MRGNGGFPLPTCQAPPRNESPIETERRDGKVLINKFLAIASFQWKIGAKLFI